MAAQLLSRVVIQQITQRVLQSVLQQLPERLARAEPGEAGPSAAGSVPSDLARMNALAIGQVRTELGRTTARVDRTDARLAELERRTGWRRTAVMVGTALAAYAVGFGTAAALVALGALG